MAAFIRMQVDGLDALGQRFADLSARMESQVAKSVTNAMAQVIRRQARVNAPVANAEHRFYSSPGAAAEEIEPGNLKRNIIVKHLPKSETEFTSESIVTVRSHGPGVQGNPHLEGVLAEFGSVKEAPIPWLRVALESEKGFAVAAAKARLEQAITAKEAIAG